MSGSSLDYEAVRNAAFTAADRNAVLREAGNGIQTAKLGFFGRILRWITGANRNIVKAMQGGLENKVQDAREGELGLAAFKMARWEKGRPDIDDPDMRSAVTARQVRDGEAYLAELLAQRRRGEAAAAMKTQINGEQLDGDRRMHYHSLLHLHAAVTSDEAAAPLAERQELPSPGEKEDESVLAERALSYVSGMTKEEAAAARIAQAGRERSARELVDTLTIVGHEPDVPGALVRLTESLQKFRTAAEEGVLDATLGQASLLGEDMQAKSRKLILTHTMDELTPLDARRIYREIMSDGGVGRALMFAAGANASRSGDNLTAAEMRNTLRDVLVALARRGGLGENSAVSDNRATEVKNDLERLSKKGAAAGERARLLEHDKWVRGFRSDQQIRAHMTAAAGVDEDLAERLVALLTQQTGISEQKRRAAEQKQRAREKAPAGQSPEPVVSKPMLRREDSGSKLEEPLLKSRGDFDEGSVRPGQSQVRKQGASEPTVPGASQSSSSQPGLSQVQKPAQVDKPDKTAVSGVAKRQAQLNIHKAREFVLTDAIYSVLLAEGCILADARKLAPKHAAFDDVRMIVMAEISKGVTEQAQRAIESGEAVQPLEANAVVDGLVRSAIRARHAVIAATLTTAAKVCEGTNSVFAALGTTGHPDLSAALQTLNTTLTQIADESGPAEKTGSPGREVLEAETDATSEAMSQRQLRTAETLQRLDALERWQSYLVLHLDRLNDTEARLARGADPEQTDCLAATERCVTRAHRLADDARRLTPHEVMKLLKQMDEAEQELLDAAMKLPEQQGLQAQQDAELAASNRTMLNEVRAALVAAAGISTGEASITAKDIGLEIAQSLNLRATDRAKTREGEDMGISAIFWEDVDRSDIRWKGPNEQGEQPLLPRPQYNASDPQAQSNAISEDAKRAKKTDAVNRLRGYLASSEPPMTPEETDLMLLRVSELVHQGVGATLLQFAYVPNVEGTPIRLADGMRGLPTSRRNENEIDKNEDENDSTFAAVLSREADGSVRVEASYFVKVAGMAHPPSFVRNLNRDESFVQIAVQFLIPPADQSVEVVGPPFMTCSFRLAVGS